MLDTYAGLTVPLIASATATFLFRQFFLTSRTNCARPRASTAPGRCASSRTSLLPLSRTNIAALFVILFIYGWNQYLWPLLVTTQENMYTGRDRHQAHDPRRRRGHRMERRDGHRDAGDAPAGAGRAADAEVVRQGPRRLPRK